MPWAAGRRLISSLVCSACCAPARVKGKGVDEVLTIKNSDIAKHLSLPPVKLHCSMLAEDAIKVCGGRGRSRAAPHLLL